MNGTARKGSLLKIIVAVCRLFHAPSHGKMRFSARPPPVHTQPRRFFGTLSSNITTLFAGRTGQVT